MEKGDYRLQKGCVAGKHLDKSWYDAAVVRVATWCFGRLRILELESATKDYLPERLRPTAKRLTGQDVFWRFFKRQAWQCSPEYHKIKKSDVWPESMACAWHFQSRTDRDAMMEAKVASWDVKRRFATMQTHKHHQTSHCETKPFTGMVIPIQKKRTLNGSTWSFPGNLNNHCRQKMLGIEITVIFGSLSPTDFVLEYSGPNFPGDAAMPSWLPLRFPSWIIN